MDEFERPFPGAYARFFFGVAVFLTLACLTTQLVALRTGHDRLLGLTKFVDLNAEQNFPTWFSSVLLFSLFLQARTISAKVRDGFSNSWKVLAWLFLIMSVDEVATMHEAVGTLLRELFHLVGYFYFQFVIPGAVLALAVALAYGRMLIRLPRPTGLGMLAAGALYVLGTIVLESLEGNWSFRHGQSSLPFFLMTDAEEFLEMLGAILMLRTLSRYSSPRSV